MSVVHLFLDVREDYAEAIGGYTVAPFANQGELEAVLQRLASHNWEYPARIVWRQPGDRRWSHMLIMGRGEGREE